MSRRFHFADDDPVLGRLDGMSGAELSALRADYGRMAQLKAAEQHVFHARIARITRILRARGRPRWEVMDHAVIRYLERVKGMDIAAVRDEIAAAVDAANETKTVKGDAVGLVVDGLTYVVTRERCVVTIHPAEDTGSPDLGS